MLEPAKLPAELVLASSSPRRKELLGLLQIPFTVRSPEIEEKELEGEAPKDLVERLAQQKAEQVSNSFPKAIVVGADTIVVKDGVVLGKPRDGQQAFEMLSALQGRIHSVWGGVAVLWKEAQVCFVNSSQTFVTMRKLSDAAIQRYIATGEPLDKAGAYGIQGWASQFVSEIQGSYSNVVGLDMSLLSTVLESVIALKTHASV